MCLTVTVAAPTVDFVNKQAVSIDKTAINNSKKLEGIIQILSKNYLT